MMQLPLLQAHTYEAGSRMIVGTSNFEPVLYLWCAVTSLWVVMVGLLRMAGCLLHRLDFDPTSRREQIR